MCWKNSHTTGVWYFYSKYGYSNWSKHEYLFKIFLYFDSRQDGGGGNVTIKAGEAGDLGAGGHFHVGGRSPTVKQSKSVTFKDC